MSARQAKEFAAKVVNDIAEDIDCGETRKELRAVISTLADDLMKAHQKYTSRENELLLAILNQKSP